MKWIVPMLLSVSTAGAQPTTPKPDSPERKAIMNAVRPLVEKKVKQKVIFKVNVLRVSKGYAFMNAQPVQPNGKPIDYRKTVYWEDIQNGAFDDQVLVLLQKTGSKWKVLEWSLGATDWPVEDWLRKHKGAPKNIVGFAGS
jgi:hypothetical protein